MPKKYIDVAVFIGSFVFALILGLLIIPVLRKLKFGQTVRDDGPQTHLVKMGVPTMGGVIFLLPIVIVSLVIYFFVPGYRDILPLVFVTMGFGFVGFLDDYIKVTRKSKDGLTPWQKMIALILISAIFAFYVYKFTDVGTVLDIKLFKFQFFLDLSYLYIPFIIFVLVAMTNAVNLTDGLDGLAGGVSFIILMFFAIYNSTNTSYNMVTLYAMTAAGAILGFLAFNLHPAKVFMGDTGSLALGGTVAVCAIYMKMPHLLLIVGLVYVLEALSVIIQVAHYKRTRKRVFRMAPLHHHFELSGWKETKVVRVFYAFTALMCLLAYIALK